jgi:uncharacterized protein
MQNGGQASRRVRFVAIAQPALVPFPAMTKPAYVLRIRRAKQPPADMEIDAPRVIVGREVADIALHDPACSSKHAEILFANGIVTLRDLASTNGTWVAGKRVAEEIMSPGIVFTIGGGTIELVAINGIESQLEQTLLMPGPNGSSTPAGTAVRLLPVQESQPFVPLRQKTRLPWRKAVFLLVAAGAVSGLMLVLRGKETIAGEPARTRLTRGREVTVKAVWSQGPIGPEASGGTTATTIRLGPNDKNDINVAVLDEFAAGAGKPWRATTWLAAFGSAQRNGQSLADYEFVVRPSGPIDGPSAGMLLTATMLAVLRGKDPRSDTTMTGTINPDGSIGPVAGIVQKMTAAAKAGVSRFGFPPGTRSQVDPESGKTVDLFATGKAAGLEVREIRDIFDAYEFLTDDRLERPVPLAESDMELDGETTARLGGKYDAWATRVRAEIGNLAAIALALGDLGKNLQPLVSQAEFAWKRAQDFRRNDDPASAWDSCVEAAVLTAMIGDAARFLKSAAAGDLADILARVDAAATVKGELAALLGEAEAGARRKTGGGQINAARALRAAVKADAFLAFADAAINEAGPLLQAQRKGQLDAEQRQRLLQRLYVPIVQYAIAKTWLEVARDQRDFGTEEGQSPPVGTRLIDRLADGYGSAAAAMLQYLESLTPAEPAAGNAKASAPPGLVENDNDYLLAARAERLAAGAAERAGDQSLLRLAASSMAFLKGASLVNKYYALGGHRDGDGNLTLTNRKALTSQLDLGKQLAREAAAKARQAIGFVPIASRLAWQLGCAKRDGNDDERLSALEAFQESTFWSELAASSPARSLGSGRK